MAIEGLELQPSPEYQQELAERYGDNFLDRVEAGMHQVPLPHLADEEVLPVVKLDAAEPQYDRQVLAVPGFSAGIVAKLPFAGDMAKHGVDLWLPGQNRSGGWREFISKKSATEAQAENYLALGGYIWERQGTEAPIDVVTQSYGSLIFQAMHRLAQERELPYFTGSKVIFMAPAGSNDHEGIISLGRRSWQAGKSESQTTKDIPDPGDMFAAGAHNRNANKLRALREMWELTRLRMDYEALAKSDLGAIMVLGFAEDDLFAHRELESMMNRVRDAGVSYAVPISLQRKDDGNIRSGKDASHNDDQFNPGRPAAAVAQILRLAA